MRVLAGLGNPEGRYGETRHNVGFRVVDILKGRLPSVRRCRGTLFSGWLGELGGQPVLLAKPATFMNESGQALRQMKERFSLSPEDFVVIHDDLDIPVGKIKLARNRGPGGHKGILSVIEELGSRDFVRVRIGIGGEEITGPRIDYVLSPFLPQEMPLVGEALAHAADACVCLLQDGMEKAMTRYHT